MSKTSRVLQFAGCRFVVKSQDQFVESIESLFFHATGNGGDVVIEELEDTAFLEGISRKDTKDANSLFIANLMSRLYARHEGCIWIDSACLQSPNGRRFLLAGQSFAGKTTLALAMALAKGWKVAAEDITLIDGERNLVLPSQAPSRIREGTIDCLKEVGGKVTLRPGCDGWYFEEAVHVPEPFPAVFDGVLILERPSDTANVIAVETLSAQECLRLILPLSNLLRLKDQIELIEKALSNASCLKVTGGDISERMALLETLI